ncbi:hypothetical protein ABZS78_36650, partial [Streptomyces decoyicus]
MKVSRYPLALVATLTVSSLALTACGGSDSDDARARTGLPLRLGRAYRSGSDGPTAPALTGPT